MQPGLVILVNEIGDHLRGVARDYSSDVGGDIWRHPPLLEMKCLNRRNSLMWRACSGQIRIATALLVKEAHGSKRKKLRHGEKGTRTERMTDGAWRGRNVQPGIN